MKHTKDEFLLFFRHMEQEEINDGPLNGMAWDDIVWYIHEAVDIDKLFTLEELHKQFPHIVILK